MQGESFPSLVKRDDETLDKNPYGENSSVQGLQPCESSIRKYTTIGDRER